MVKSRLVPSLVTGLLMSAALSLPARADVVYDLSIVGGGTGVLDLNLASTAAADNLSSLGPYFVSLTLTNVGGTGFSVTLNSANSSNYQFETGAQGQIYNLSVIETRRPAVWNTLRSIIRVTIYIPRLVLMWRLETTVLRVDRPLLPQSRSPLPGP
jgi:hypothetical protein